MFEQQSFEFNGMDYDPMMDAHTTTDSVIVSGTSNQITFPDYTYIKNMVWIKDCTGPIYLGKSLTVEGHLVLDNCYGPIVLPEEGFVVKSSMIIDNCPAISQIPSQLYVKNDLMLANCNNLQYVLEGVRIHGRLQINNCPRLISIPSRYESIGANCWILQR